MSGLLSGGALSALIGEVMYRDGRARHEASDLLDKASDGAEKVQQLVTDLQDGKGKDRLRGFVCNAAERRGLIDAAGDEVQPDGAVTVDTVTEAEADMGVNVMMTALSGAAAETGQSVDALLDAYNGGAPTPETEHSAKLLLRAILMAARADALSAGGTEAQDATAKSTAILANLNRVIMSKPLTFDRVEF